MRVGDFFSRIAEEIPAPAEVAAEIDPPFILAANVYHLRTAHGLTQTQLARAVGIAQPRIAEIERGDANPTLGTLVKLAHALGVSVSVLLDPACADQDPAGDTEPPAVTANLQWSQAVEELEEISATAGAQETSSAAAEPDDLAQWAARLVERLPHGRGIRQVSKGVVFELSVFESTYAQRVR
ncbi:MAG TPA: helix-turn-helix domain-containing protein [Longimicrobiaceae bacterium]|nr:helix-turn-helix domain-containing protein [Longimicrobiaceae bacterium]